MNHKELIDAFAQLAKEKGIARTEVADIIESVFESIIRKKYGDVDNFDIIVNTDKGEIEIYQELEVVADEDLDDEVREISLTEARKRQDVDDVEPGDVIVQVIDPDIFGRRAISAAKQVLSQKIRELERNQIYEEYTNRIGEIIVGSIHQIRRGESLFVNIDKTELKMPRREQIETERYRRGDTIKAIIKEVNMTPKGPEIIISRADESFLRRLFELEVPEIFDGIVEIKAIARVPGRRSKIIVESNDKRIDAVGACVGIKGSRIKTIVNELAGENVDIINYSHESEVLISRALSPAKPLFIEIDEDRRTALAVFDDNEIATAIGTGGININLTSQVTGYDIDAIRRSEYNRLEGDDIFIEDLEGITKAQVDALQEAGIETVADFLNTETANLLKIKGIGEKTFEKIETIVQDALQSKRDKQDELDLDDNQG
ncbi:TPA: transcription termination factor NusA [Candidatus Marinimicrobia bacterium]|nr:MAG: NusA antitermination factor [Marinimicrobia bacterium 46_47]KUK91496.1 MAG: transcription elongation factor NusA [Marinimicrobia bacterium 46_43]HAE87745.1 transcription termination factor NusA [Candidatus Neomarinimicrobiota bacterium]HBY17950.1 transcription termination factor NusA [Candidatus Neomarinimicrobiota bacterium]